VPIIVGTEQEMRPRVAVGICALDHPRSNGIVEVGNHGIADASL
jgi:hypothetical protein